MPKHRLNIDVLEAAKQRTKWTFDNFKKVYLSFSAGKDSTVMLHVVMEEAKKRNQKNTWLCLFPSADWLKRPKKIQKSKGWPLFTREKE